MDGFYWTFCSCPHNHDLNFDRHLFLLDFFIDDLLFDTRQEGEGKKRTCCQCSKVVVGKVDSSCMDACRGKLVA